MRKRWKAGIVAVAGLSVGAFSVVKHGPNIIGLAGLGDDWDKWQRDILPMITLDQLNAAVIVASTLALAWVVWGDSLKEKFVKPPPEQIAVQYNLRRERLSQILEPGRSPISPDKRMKLAKIEFDRACYTAEKGCAISTKLAPEIAAWYEISARNYYVSSEGYADAMAHIQFRLKKLDVGH
jgi:hypothetical protein